MAGIIRKDSLSELTDQTGPEVIIKNYDRWHIWKQEHILRNNTWAKEEITREMVACRK